MIIPIIVGIVFAAFFAYYFYVQHRMKKEGVEANAFVSRVEVHEAVEAEDSDSVTVYAKYKDQNGELQEAALNRPPRNLTVGAPIRIRYVPAIKNYANFLSIIESDTSENEMR